MIMAILLMAGAVLAQEDATEQKDTLWTISGTTSLNLSQLALYNWAAGGDNNIAGNALVKLSADYDNGSMLWDNDLTLGLGMVKIGDDPTRKSNDQIHFSSKAGYKASKKWAYSALLDFKTQFAEGFDDPGDPARLKISNFMAPAYLNLALGMDYKPNEHISLFLSPVTGKITFVLDEDLSAAGSFGLDPDQTIRGEFGAFVKFAYKQEILRNVTLDTRIDLFSNYLENPQYVDVNWDMLLTFKVNEYISAALLTSLIYDYDIKFEFDNNGVTEEEARVQFKELFGLGLTYSF